MRVLVTGGSGFIGSHVVDKLRARGHEPVIYDLRPSPWHASDEVETVLGSITDREALERAMAGCDAVAHLAAMADVNDVHAEPEDAEHVNARGTAAVLEAARRAGVMRVAYASTIWVYSDCDPEDVDEDTLLAPPSHLYTSTKLAGELYCKAYKELYGIDYTILRFGIPYGPRAREAAVIPAFVNKALAGEPLTLAGDGLQSRKFVYVEDLADGVASGLHEAAANRVYNLASDETVTIKQIAETIQELIGDVEIVYTPARPGDFGGKTVCSRRAAAELGWTAATPFSVGVRKYIEWRHEQAGANGARHNGSGANGATRPREDSGRSHGGGELASAGEPHQHPQGANVLVISADIGEGHDLPARAVAREFREREPSGQVSIVNGLPAMGRLLTALLRTNSAFLFTYLPWLFDLQYRMFMSGPSRWLARRLLYGAGRRGLMRLIAAHDPDLIVSTYPGVTAILGELRRSGRLRIPCYSSITDLAGLQYWAHPGIDLHFITHPESAAEVERIAGAGSVRWAKPPTRLEFDEPRARSEARRALGLPATGTVIAISGGGWGVGDLIGATETALELPGATVLCLCGAQQPAARRRPGPVRIRVAAAGDGLHRADRRRAGRVRCADPLDRRADRARGDHPRLPGDLLRLRLRPRARVQPGARALRPGAGRQATDGADAGAPGGARGSSRARSQVRAASRDRGADRLRGPARAAAACVAAADGSRVGGARDGVRVRVADVDDRRGVLGRVAFRPDPGDHRGADRPCSGRRDRRHAPGRDRLDRARARRRRDPRLVRDRTADRTAGADGRLQRRPVAARAAARRAGALAVDRPPAGPGARTHG